MTNKVLLTGATGFIGRHAIRPLIERGFEVHAPYIGPKGEDSTGLRWHACNLLDSNETSLLVNEVKPTHMLHFAWYAIPGKYWTAPENMHWLSASLSLAEAFVNAGGKRAVVAGTCAEYSWKQGLCCEKETPLEPETLYGISKASLYRVLSSYASLSDLSLAWGRIFFLYGSNEPKGRLVPAVINNLLDNKEAPCSHGQQIRDFMHVQDVADAFTALLDSEIEGAVNIASGSPVTIKEVVTMIADKIDSQSKPEFGAIAANPTEPPKILAETARLKNELGWEPRYTLEQGIDETINWWSNQMAAR